MSIGHRPPAQVAVVEHSPKNEVAKGRDTAGYSRQLRLLKRALLSCFLLCCVGELFWDSERSAQSELPDAEPVVHLMRASLPQPLRFIASHYWFSVFDGESWSRFEVLQNANLGGQPLGHLHINRLEWDSDMGGGPAIIVKSWKGTKVREVLTCLRDAAPHYSYKDHYRAWPGPNSNTYAEAMLRECEMSWSLSGSAIGKDYRGLIGISLTSESTGVQIESPLVGLRLGLKEGVEVHFLSLTVGFDFWPPALVHPFGDGRFGFD